MKILASRGDSVFGHEVTLTFPVCADDVETSYSRANELLQIKLDLSNLKTDVAVRRILVSD